MVTALAFVRIFLEGFLGNSSPHKDLKLEEEMLSLPHPAMTYPSRGGGI